MTQRLRVTFAKEGPLRWVAHLDLMRTWERTIRRAVLPLSYSQGFSPHARIALAAPLPVGVEGRGELIDLWLDDTLRLEDVAKRLAAAMPPGLSISEVKQVSDDLPSMQSCLLAARYEVLFDADDLDRVDLEAALERLLALESLEWEEQRGKKTRNYDLRATVLEAAVDLVDAGTLCLRLHLSLEPGRTGRPAQVLKAMEIEVEPRATIRTEIEFTEAGRGTSVGTAVVQPS